MVQRALREDTWKQRLTVDERRALTPRIDGQVRPDGTCLLERHTRLDLERPAATAPVGGGAREEDEGWTSRSFLRHAAGRT